MVFQLLEFIGDLIFQRPSKALKRLGDLVDATADCAGLFCQLTLLSAKIIFDVLKALGIVAFWVPTCLFAKPRGLQIVQCGNDIFT
ncbi:Resolvase domain-containing protein, putative [Babesia ovata]|uniref:Resolvase domain-containing protein, putative n=1 Tax=Babesia ovata TaxID=189622 RepID=A0A2H6KDH6_9APIC|nr:Resolvase domain-containing protein, putative [Babesia ovata]GBE61009.1 Resolvase domain-containing protein, putative [Babesia ovata]